MGIEWIVTLNKASTLMTNGGQTVRFGLSGTIPNRRVANVTGLMTKILGA